MRVRSAVVGVICSLGLVVAGCSHEPPAPAPQRQAPVQEHSDTAAGVDSNPFAQMGTSGGTDGDNNDFNDAANALGQMMDQMVGGGCGAWISFESSLSLLFIPVVTGGTLTQDQVDQTFGQLPDDVPDEIKDDIVRLHQGANAMVGKSGAAAQQILDSDEFNNAKDRVDDYWDSQCSPNSGN